MFVVFGDVYYSRVLGSMHWFLHFGSNVGLGEAGATGGGRLQSGHNSV